MEPPSSGFGYLETATEAGCPKPFITGWIHDGTVSRPGMGS